MNFDYSSEPKRDIFLIDVKSFYASVECVQRGYDPLTKMLVVMSAGDNTGSGLVLAASPMAKRILGISNVTRGNELPDNPSLEIVPPRMRLYIRENMKINKIYNEYVADQDLHFYSIDESILDCTASLNLFVPDDSLTRSEKRVQLANMIQNKVKKETGLIVTIGIGDNPLLAKLALDNAAKYNSNFVAEWTYENVKETIWNIPTLTDFWGIGSRTEKSLNLMGIRSIEELANCNPWRLKNKFGVIGLQLYHHANGIDRSIISEPYKPIEKSYGNSQVLDRDYVRQEEIETVIREMADQVATRIRKHHCQTMCIHIYIGYSLTEAEKALSRQMKIPATNNTKKLTEHCLQLFRRYYSGKNVRHIGITYKNLIYTENVQLDLFEEPEITEAQEKLDKIVDKIRMKFGFTKLVHAASLKSSGRAIKRSSLLGGHTGGMDGLENEKNE
ncbi:Y-family DNA polymerase [Enterococcus rivorum]|uniref:Excinuclease ABC subunit A n=1 Tax=Enterococcus rivorum TaxID=762845 RepID=A0A1E5L0K4_9ENTE|nr:Y-family DNA polymerase [Enterococcus rivorum]MBP2098886.1 DNA polymerase V [Enterococcus rivorum]OEH83613.1 excinuclease ABC subunit A [Enterococcus rivorum]